MHFITFSSRRGTWETNSLSLSLSLYCWFPMSHSPISSATSSFFSNGSLDFLQYTIPVILVDITTGVNLFVNIIPRLSLLLLRGLIEYFFDVREEFCSPTCTIGCWKIVTCYLPAINYTSGDGKFLPDIKEIFNNPLEAKKRSSRYYIYK
jgi:hypothetical protein